MFKITTTFTLSAALLLHQTFSLKLNTTPGDYTEDKDIENFMLLMALGSAIGMTHDSVEAQHDAIFESEARPDLTYLLSTPLNSASDLLVMMELAGRMGMTPEQVASVYDAVRGAAESDPGDVSGEVQEVTDSDEADGETPESGQALAQRTVQDIEDEIEEYDPEQPTM